MAVKPTSPAYLKRPHPPTDINRWKEDKLPRPQGVRMLTQREIDEIMNKKEPEPS